MRVFVSIDLPDHLVDAVADAQDRFADADGLRFVDPDGLRFVDPDGLRFVDPDTAHRTLFVIGEVDPDRIDGNGSALERAADDAGVDPLGMRVGGVGVFPALEDSSVVWTGVRRGPCRNNPTQRSR
ncbi:hypothetical protein GCM10008995_14320 [Halobellus salinus]|uniref:Phosphoesterase HXTX domain-containing protein n=1 Tax=Halobellus salinus TaxID=931585 RepID=A0A830EF12_9EURY|nr:2'-5' RNA ligase family protein [Halobellus salinus]GGJ05645.1 hypothetical protein GCM10008995_14320 [Halobellus salinus]SMP23656.1 LigT like Phosphoesterase [Halobellus salinus]